jgi:hypothetical protein
MSIRPAVPSFLAAVAIAAVAGACNPYDPELGAHPFKCGTSEPRCPDGYACVEHAAGEAFCEVPRVDPLAPDAAADAPPLTCSLDRTEPNQSTATAFVLGNAITRDLTLCPSGDVDYFSFTTDTANLRVTVTSDGVLVKSGESPPGKRDTTELRILPIAAGDYFLRIASGSSSGGGEQAAYGIELKMCAGPATCIE